jgi:ACT domain-containing protein
MIDGKTKQKFLKELEKYGNAYLSCLKVGINRSTFYRWKDSDKDFRKHADRSISQGRENISDIAEYSLVQNVKEKKMDAIKYVLSHNSPRYRQKPTSNVVILHKTMSKNLSGPEKGIDQALDEVEKMYDEQNRTETERIKQKYENMGIPTKADGTIIGDNELVEYEKYIEEWYKKKEIEEAKITADTVDSKPKTDQSSTMPQND